MVHHSTSTFECFEDLIAPDSCRYANLSMGIYSAVLVVICWRVMLFLESLFLEHGLTDLAPKSILCFFHTESEQYFLIELSIPKFIFLI